MFVALVCRVMRSLRPNSTRPIYLGMALFRLAYLEISTPYYINY